MAEKRGDWRAPFAALGGGLVLGLSGLSPALWPLAWVGVGTSAWALAAEDRPASAVTALILGALLTRICWFAWVPAMSVAMIPDSRALQAAYCVAFVLVVAGPVVLTLALCAWLFHGVTGAVRLWLPVAWVIAERQQSNWTSVSSDWLFTQVDWMPAMEALHAYGLEVATWMCLFAAASVGEAIAERRRSWVGPAVVAVLCLLLAPALPTDAAGELEGLGVVHMPHAGDLPAVDRVDAELPLVVWPEVSHHAQPPVREGSGANWRLDAAPGGPNTWHLIGVETPERYGRQNMAVVVSADGTIHHARAKSGLMPIFETPYLGMSVQRFEPGVAAPFLRVGARRAIALICGEILQRNLVRAGLAAGGDLLVVMARDRYQGGSSLADRHVLTKLRLRAIEFGVPAVYASMGGRASIVSPRGEVLARSDADAPAGVLTWSTQKGAIDHQPVLDPPVTVLYSASTPRLVPDCAPGRCRYLSLEEVEENCDEASARTVLVSAHGDGVLVGGLDPDQFGRSVACFDPELVVLDVCYGASSAVLAGLARHTDAVVVGVPAFLGARGFRYESAFFTAVAAEERALAVDTVPASAMYVGRPDPQALAAAESWVAGTDGDTLRPKVVSWVPTLVGVTPETTGRTILVPADWRRIGHPPEL